RATSGSSSPRRSATARWSSPTTSAPTTAPPSAPPSRSAAPATCRSRPTLPTSIRSRRPSPRSSSSSVVPQPAPTTLCVTPPAPPSTPSLQPMPTAGSPTAATRRLINPHEEGCSGLGGQTQNRMSRAILESERVLVLPHYVDHLYLHYLYDALAGF